MRRLLKAILVFLVGVSAGTMTPAVFSQESTSEARSGLEATVTALVPGLTAAELTVLISEGEITNMYEAPAVPRLAPAFADVVAADLAALDPRLGVELIVLLRTPGIAAIPQERMFTVLQSISTMAGIEYYSASRGYMRTLFYESYIVDDPDHHNRLPDPVRQVAPEHDRLYIYQRDSSFGKNILQLDYRTDGDAILLTMRNLTRMVYRGIVPAVGPERLLLHLIVIPVGDYLLFYGSSAADPVSLLGMEERARTSFHNRIIALRSWYLDQLESIRE
ncbi:MAG: DUF6675 family protein [Spirochaetia bacterium]